MAITRLNILSVVCLFVTSCSLLVASEDTTAEKKPVDKTDVTEKNSEVAAGVMRMREEVTRVTNASCNLEKATRLAEVLNYQVKYKGLPAGRIELRAKRIALLRGRKSMIFEMHCESNNIVDVLYPVDSTIKSYVDMQDGRSYLFMRKLNEGRRRIDDRLEFDYGYRGKNLVRDETLSAAPLSRYSKVKKDKQVYKSESRSIPGPVQDSLSIIYYIRHLDLSDPSVKHKVLVGSKKRTDVVTINIIGNEQLTLNSIGTFDCVIVEPKGEEDTDRTNIVAVKGSAELWLEKNTKIPLMIKVEVPFGHVTAALIEAKNTDLDKYKVDAPSAK